MKDHEFLIHIQRARNPLSKPIPLLTPEQEAELEKDLVPKWYPDGPVRILPVHRPAPNAELINDRVKLFFHRLIARRLGQDPSLVHLARQELARTRERREYRTYMDEWEALLSLDVEELRRVIVRRDEQMTRLRISSPMGPLIDVRDPDLRRRIWRNARKALSARA